MLVWYGLSSHITVFDRPSPHAVGKFFNPFSFGATYLEFGGQPIYPKLIVKSKDSLFRLNRIRLPAALWPGIYGVRIWQIQEWYLAGAG